MAFKVKNLMIQVLPSADETALFQPPLIAAAFCGGLSFTSGRNCSVRDLAIYKAQLQEALARVQEQERELDKQMGPQTLEEAEALEAHLVAALEEVQRQKEELQNKAAGGQG